MLDVSIKYYRGYNSNKNAVCYFLGKHRTYKRTFNLTSISFKLCLFGCFTCVQYVMHKQLHNNEIFVRPLERKQLVWHYITTKLQTSKLSNRSKIVHTLVAKLISLIPTVEKKLATRIPKLRCIYCGSFYYR